MDKPIVRIFVGEFGTVRWETKVKGKGLELVVKGPRDAVAVHEFQDPLELVEFQSTAERRLLNTGYQVSPVDRRVGGDRRSKSRAKDRRRSE